MWAILCCLLRLGTQSEALETEGSAWYLRSPEEISDGVRGICWSHSSRLGVTALRALAVLLSSFPTSVAAPPSGLTCHASCLSSTIFIVSSILIPGLSVHSEHRCYLARCQPLGNGFPCILYPPVSYTAPLWCCECFRGIFAQPPARCGKTQPISSLLSSHSLPCFSPAFSRHWNVVLSISHSFYYFNCTPLPLSEQLSFAIVTYATV